MARIDLVRIKSLCREGMMKAYIESDGIYLKDAISGEVVKLGDTPTVDAARAMHGRWEYGVDHYKPLLSEPYDLVTSLICSECNYRWTSKQGVEYGDKPDYCPSCGAKMDKEEP